MFFYGDETTFILQLLEISKDGLSGAVTAMLIVLFGVLIAGAGILLSVIVASYFYTIEVHKYEVEKKTMLVYIGMIPFLLSIIFLCSMALIQLSMIDKEGILKYAKIRYIDNIKNDPNINPEVKEEIERYIEQREKYIEEYNRLSLMERFKNLNTEKKNVQ